MEIVSSEPFFGQPFFSTARISLGTDPDCKLPESVSPHGRKEPKYLSVLQDFS